MEVENDLRQTLKFPELKNIRVTDCEFWRGKFQRMTIKWGDDWEREINLNSEAKLADLKELVFVFNSIIEFCEKKQEEPTLESRLPAGRLIEPEELEGKI